jgi:hypothetical protein
MHRQELLSATTPAGVGVVARGALVVAALMATLALSVAKTGEVLAAQPR